MIPPGIPHQWGSGSRFSRRELKTVSIFSARFEPPRANSPPKGSEPLGRSFMSVLARLLVTALPLASFVTPPAAPLGSSKFVPTADPPLGWRGDGTGRY